MTTKKTGRPAAKHAGGRPKSEMPKSKQLALRVDAETSAKFDEACAKYRVSRSEILRWMIDDAANGEWIPSHLRKIVGR